MSNVANELRDITNADIIAEFDHQVSEFNTQVEGNYNPDVLFLLADNCCEMAEQLQFSPDKSRDWKAERTKWSGKRNWAQRVAMAAGEVKRGIR